MSSEMWSTCFSRWLKTFFSPSYKRILYEERVFLRALSLGLVIAIVCGFKLLEVMCSVIMYLTIAVSVTMLVFRMLLFKVRPRSTNAWSWMRISNNSRTNEFLILQNLYSTEVEIVKLIFSSEKLQNVDIFATYLNKFSTKMYLKSPVALSHFTPEELWTFSIGQKYLYIEAMQSRQARKQEFFRAGEVSWN